MEAISGNIIHRGIFKNTNFSCILQNIGETTVKIISIVGARPQFIKAAPVSRALKKYCREILVHTGQHYDINMSEIFFSELNIPLPDYNLEVGSGTHGQQTGQILIKAEEVMLKEKPDAVLVYGDTNSTLAGALAASKLHIPVAHVEAGLRSFNMKMPEEQNRIVTDHLSTLLFCPTDTAVRNLKNEGITKGVFNTGDVMYDAVLYNMRQIEKTHTMQGCLRQLKLIDGFTAKDIPLLAIQPNAYYLTTIHRAENTDSDNRMQAILCSLGKLQLPVLLPLHPRTRKIIRESPEMIPQNIFFVEPIGYQAMLYLTKNAKAIITDSGGLQKEAYFLNVPCVTVRDETEWIETLEGRWNVLSRSDAIAETVERSDIDRSNKKSLFGDGSAAEKIAAIISDHIEYGAKAHVVTK
jgi:UDP-N-acetylglucosamine 2-epimerase